MTVGPYIDAGEECLLADSTYKQDKSNRPRFACSAIANARQSFEVRLCHIQMACARHVARMMFCHVRVAASEKCCQAPLDHMFKEKSHLPHECKLWLKALGPEFVLGIAVLQAMHSVT